MRHPINTLLVSSLLLGLTLTQTAFAEGGGQSGGGGNAIVCFSNPDVVKKIRDGRGYIEDEMIPYIKSVEMLDLRKAKQPRLVNGVKVTSELMTANPNESEEMFEARAFTRLNNVFPQFMTKLSEAKNNYLSELRSVPHGISRIDDVGSLEIYDSKSCVRATIIAQYEEETKTNVIFDERIYNLPTSIFSIENRVASRWHEYFYYYSRMKGSVNSQFTQSVVGTLFQKKLTFGEASIAISRFSEISNIQNITNSRFFPKIVLPYMTMHFNESLNKNKLQDFTERRDLKYSKWALLLPIPVLHFIPMSIAYNIQKQNFEKQCDKAFEEASKVTEQIISYYSKLLNESILVTKDKFPIQYESLFQKIADFYMDNIQKVKINKRFYSGFNSSFILDDPDSQALCLIQDTIENNFFKLELPIELKNELLEMKL